MLAAISNILGLDTDGSIDSHTLSTPVIALSMCMTAGSLGKQKQSHSFPLGTLPVEAEQFHGAQTLQLTAVGCAESTEGSGVHFYFHFCESRGKKVDLNEHFTTLSKFASLFFCLLSSSSAISEYIVHLLSCTSESSFLSSHFFLGKSFPCSLSSHMHSDSTNREIFLQGFRSPCL